MPCVFFQFKIAVRRNAPFVELQTKQAVGPGNPNDFIVIQIDVGIHKQMLVALIADDRAVAYNYQIPCIDPPVFQQRPPVVGKSLKYIFVWQPTVAILSPINSP